MHIVSEGCDRGNGESDREYRRRHRCGARVARCLFCGGKDGHRRERRDQGHRRSPMQHHGNRCVGKANGFRAESKTCTKKSSTMTLSVGVTNGERRRSRHATTTSATTSGATADASKRCIHSQSVPSLRLRNQPPVAERPVGAGESGAVDAGPASQHDRQQCDRVGRQRQARRAVSCRLSA